MNAQSHALDQRKKRSYSQHQKQQQQQQQPNGKTAFGLESLHMADSSEDDVSWVERRFE